MQKALVPKLDAVLDIETGQWDQFVVGGFYDGETFEAFTWREEKKLIDRLLALPKGFQVWTWNGGRFDTIWISDRLNERGLDDCIVTFGGSGINTLEIRGGCIIRDGFRLFPTKLSKAAELTDIEKAPTGLECVCGECADGEAYCAISRGMSQRDLEILIRYLRVDCKVTWAVIETILARLTKDGFVLRGTIGGTAWATAKKWCGLESAKWPTAQHYKFARGGYYGGRVEVFRPESTRGYRYDINSAYPAALDRLDLPTGPMRFLEGTDCQRAYLAESEGIYRCTVYVPKDMFIPPLPTRIGDRLAYPVGRIVGDWTGLLLRYAESIGVTIEKFHTALCWCDKEPVLRDYQRRVWTFRSTAESQRWRAFYKWYANSQTGKLAQQPEHESYALNPRPSDVKRCPGGDCRGYCKSTRCCDHQCVGRCGAWEMKDRRGRVWGRKAWRIASCGHVQWAAYLTSGAQIQLHKQLVAVDGGRDAVYCDTDSCYAENERTDDVGPGLGQWSFDGVFRRWGCVAPKLYVYWDPKDGEIVRAKGMSKAQAREVRRMLAGERVEIIDDRGVMSLKSAVRAQKKHGGALFRRKNIIRKSHADAIHYGSRIRGADGLTYPRTVAELLRDEYYVKKRSI